MKYFLYFSTDLEKLVEGFCLFFLNKNQKKQFLEPTITLVQEKPLMLTHGIVHAGFRGLRSFVARKKSRCKLVGNCLVIPHDTIP